MQPEVKSCLEDVRRAATARGRAQTGAFVTEGRRLLERGMRAGWLPRVVLLGEALELAPLHRELTERGLRAHVAPDAALLALSQGRRSGLVTALFELPQLPSVDQLLSSCAAAQTLLVLVDIDEPGNVGALIRTALAAGAFGAVCVGSSDPFHPKAVRTSLGSLFKLKLVRLESTGQLLDALRQYGVHCVAAVARAGEALDRARWPPGVVALCVGNEGSGLPESVRAAADTRVSIDLSSEADSFSVNAAAAICLYEIQRRRRGEAGV